MTTSFIVIGIAIVIAKTCILDRWFVSPGGVGLTVGSVPRRIVPKRRQFNRWFNVHFQQPMKTT